MDILDQLDLIKKIDIIELMNKSIEQNESEIIDTITESQMLLGQNSLNKAIGFYSSKMYEQFKRSLNSNADGRVDLKLTGNLYHSFTLKKINEGYELTSPLTYFTKLSDKYGVEAFDLSDQNAAILAKGEIIESFLILFKNGMRM